MILTISTTYHPATDLGYLLGKHPERHQTRELNFGTAHIFYPEVSEERCTVALLLEMNPIQETRRRDRHQPRSLEHYVTDRPYVLSSFFTTALSKVFGTALNGNCRERPELVDQPLPLEVELAALPVRGGEEVLAAFFEPLGYEWEAETTLLDPQFPEWGDSPYYRLLLRHELPLRQLLSHLYLLIPALDRRQHYYISDSEIDKLLAKGEPWLPAHPARDRIVGRYLTRRSGLTSKALDQLGESSEPEQAEVATATADVEKPLRLHAQRHARVVKLLREAGATSVLDLGCGDGKLLQQLLRVGEFTRITGVEPEVATLKRAADRLRLDHMTPKQRERIELFQGALTYRDERFAGYDAAVLVEVIEHIDPPLHTIVERVIFRYARPQTVIVTTPNREYNELFENLTEARLRHPDHRFEWTRAEFQDWAEHVAAVYNYQVRIEPLGPKDERYGAPSQVAIFNEVMS
jgi:3' terminal RNA ribose 2'-O-methyltransferase Hen1